MADCIACGGALGIGRSDELCFECGAEMERMNEATDEAHTDGFRRGVRAAIAALYYQAGHLDAVADDLRRRDKCGHAATCERKSARLAMAAMSLKHVRSVAYQEGGA